ncbi:hypothetical protein AVEN_90478-1 [Araneus ventricosus]|uniref:Uncharacterized protein n=1 Tax=Araneus ventricosus TaxID=182803 RepID=A0A4Y2SCH4_ARAVE|nr:hypothetical protein AVEN_90478-1 [Araneus ventricosus]
MLQNTRQKFQAAFHPKKDFIIRPDTANAFRQWHALQNDQVWSCPRSLQTLNTTKPLNNGHPPPFSRKLAVQRGGHSKGVPSSIIGSTKYVFKQAIIRVRALGGDHPLDEVHDELDHLDDGDEGEAQEEAHVASDVGDQGLPLQQ